MSSDHGGESRSRNRLVSCSGCHIADPSVVEDHSGRAITLSLLNYDNLPVVLPRSMISDRYPVGAVFAVKEPYIGLGHTTGIAEIRVAVRIDIERLPSSPSTKWRFPSPVGARLPALS